jgi:organic radical activating enzyme
MKNKDLKADIAEIFSSVQGEGIFVGAKQIFVRFSKCNMNCAYCDEPRSRKAKSYSASGLMTEIRRLNKKSGPHHSVSFTGGEPLLYADFLRDPLELLKEEGLRSYLETNGTLPEELAKIIGLLDIIAMDIKLPSSTGEREFWVEHYEFLKIASAKKVFAKLVVTANTVAEDIQRSVELIKSVDESIPLILQPATAINPLENRIDSQTIMSFLDICSKNRLDDVRVIPQVHKILGIK